MNLELKPSQDEQLIENVVGFRGKILFGIPEDTAQRGSDSSGNPTYNNAQILAVMEAGSPVMNIPARKLLEPVVMKHIDQIRERFDVIYNLLINGDNESVDREMEILAQKVEMWCKAYFREDNGWAPNSPITIKGGWMKNKKSGKPVYVKGKGSDRPLIDTGELRKAIRGLYVKK